MREDEILELIKSSNYIALHDDWDEIIAQYAKAVTKISGKVTSAELAAFVALGMSIYRKGLADKLGDTQNPDQEADDAPIITGRSSGQIH